MGSAEKQGQLWGADARAWSELNEPHCAPLYEAVFDAIGVGSGTVLLDAGCGAGLAVQLAAKRGAVVSGLDASGALLEIAQERNPDADLRQGDLEDLPFADDSFDAVTAFNSVQYATDPIAAVRQLGRVTRPGGSVGVLTWGPPEQCETSTILVAIGGLLPPPPPGAEGPFALSAPGRLEALVESAGLRPSIGGEATMAFQFPDLEAAVRAQLTSGPARVAIEHAGLPAVRAALAEAYTSNRQADGSYRQENVFRYLIASVGGTSTSSRTASAHR
jgi:SAM-dependent methyltransferase